MAQLTNDGRIISSGNKYEGTTRAWAFLRRWVDTQLPAQVARARAATKRR